MRANDLALLQRELPTDDAIQGRVLLEHWTVPPELLGK